MPAFNSTTEAIAAGQISKKKFKCPFPKCTDKRIFHRSQELGMHLARVHGMHSSRTNGNKATNGKRASMKALAAGMPVLHIQFCPNCGTNIQALEQAAYLLNKQGK